MLLCLQAGCLGAAERSDQLPRYGGEDRGQGVALAQDRAMVGLAVLRYPSRSAASAASLAEALVLLERGDREMAMRRLNRAWVLDPANPGLDAAFARVAEEGQEPGLAR